jgi:hypothetical protein
VAHQVKETEEAADSMASQGTGAPLVSGEGVSASTSQGRDNLKRIFNQGVTDGHIQLTEGRLWDRLTGADVSSRDVWAQIAGHLVHTYKWTDASKTPAQEVSLAPKTAYGYLGGLFIMAYKEFSMDNNARRSGRGGKTQQFFEKCLGVNNVGSLTKSEEAQWWTTTKSNVYSMMFEKAAKEGTLEDKSVMPMSDAIVRSICVVSTYL